jgi:hypothetical protein
MSEPLPIRVVVTHHGAAAWITGHGLPPAGFPEIKPGMKGTLEKRRKRLVADDCVVKFDNLPCPVVLPMACIVEDKLTPHIVE